LIVPTLAKGLKSIENFGPLIFNVCPSTLNALPPALPPELISCEIFAQILILLTRDKVSSNLNVIQVVTITSFFFVYVIYWVASKVVIIIVTMNSSQGYFELDLGLN